MVNFGFEQMTRPLGEQVLESTFNFEASVSICDVGDVTFRTQIRSLLNGRLDRFHEVKLDESFQNIVIETLSIMHYYLPHDKGIKKHF